MCGVKNLLLSVTSFCSRGVSIQCILKEIYDHVSITKRQKCVLGGSLLVASHYNGFEL